MNSKNMNVTLDEHVRSMMAWHFGADTGSAFWLRRMSSLGFDPIRDVKTFSDLQRFPDVVDEWRTIPVTDLIPRGLPPGTVHVWETGGTTGAPGRVIDADVRDAGGRLADRTAYLEVLDAFGFPSPMRDGKPCGWLNALPTGPHRAGHYRRALGEARGCIVYMIDLDPRWVKRLYREGQTETAQAYVAHVIEQCLDVLRSQPIGVLCTTPPLLQALCDNGESYDLIRQKVRGIIWGGTSMSEESLRAFQEDLLPGIPMVGSYGNTLVGAALQRPPMPGDRHRCVFSVYHPTWPAFVLEIVDPNDHKRPVDVGEVGRVRVNAIRADVFLPNHLERDLAIRLPPAPGGQNPSLTLVRPLNGAKSEVEGVY